jgi:hypothetical protein
VSSLWIISQLGTRKQPIPITNSTVPDVLVTETSWESRWCEHIPNLRLVTGLSREYSPLSWLTCVLRSVHLWWPSSVSLGIKRPGREAHHSPPSSAEIKNAWRYTSTLPYVFMASCLIKHRDSFTYVGGILYNSCYKHVNKWHKHSKEVYVL